MALLADITPEYHRTKAMALIGMTIGISFSLAMVISPIVSNEYGLSGIFILTTILALLGLALLYIIPTPDKPLARVTQKSKLAHFKQVLFQVNLQRLNFGIFCQHFILTATFFVIPILLKEQLALPASSQAIRFYLPLIMVLFSV